MSTKYATMGVTHQSKGMLLNSVVPIVTATYRCLPFNPTTKSSGIVR